MNTNIPRLRMFAGPNGSGKSTFKAIIRNDLYLLITLGQVIPKIV